MYSVIDAPTPQRPDMDIEADSRQAIAQLDTANSVGLDIEVSVLHGQVTLTGHTRSEMAGPGIVQAVRAVQGTRQVLNQLFDDSSLVRQLATALAYDPRTQAIPPGYQVVSALGHTLVVGKFASDALRTAVIDVCQDVRGVRSVQVRSPEEGEQHD